MMLPGLKVLNEWVNKIYSNDDLLEETENIEKIVQTLSRIYHIDMTRLNQEANSVYYVIYLSYNITLSESATRMSYAERKSLCSGMFYAVKNIEKLQVMDDEIEEAKHIKNMQENYKNNQEIPSKLKDEIALFAIYIYCDLEIANELQVLKKQASFNYEDSMMESYKIQLNVSNKKQSKNPIHDKIAQIYNIEDTEENRVYYKLIALAFKFSMNMIMLENSRNRKYLEEINRISIISSIFYTFLEHIKDERIHSKWIINSYLYKSNLPELYRNECAVDGIRFCESVYRGDKNGKYGVLYGELREIMTHIKNRKGKENKQKIMH